MARPKRSKLTPHYVINLGLSLTALGVFAVVGVRVANTTSAATANPYGSADYCTIENNATVLYGWAADPDASSLSAPAVSLIVGDRTVTAQTNRANYRDTSVANWIQANRRGDPLPGSYGFKISLPGLYQGTQIPLSGTVLNEGGGSNTILTINNTAPIDGDGTKHFFKDNLIPEACLVPAPIPSQTASTPSTTAPSLPSPKAATATSAGAVALAGTMAAELKIRTDNTATVRVTYGKNPANLDLSSPDMPVSGAETTIPLTGLTPATTYAYRIIRTDVASKKVTTPMGNFSTLGYVISLHFVDSKNKGIAGIPVTVINTNKEKTSDDNGDIRFTEVADGNHSVKYTYLGKTYTKTFPANASLVSPEEAAAPRVVTLDYSIDIQAAAVAKNQPLSKNGNDTALILVAGLGLLAGILVIAAFALRRNKRRYTGYSDDPAPPLPDYQPLAPPVMPGQKPRQAEHIGESLKDLVIRSMTEEAQSPYSKDHRQR
ncbi:MAG: hypothetical protein JWP13_497 [Candidatus Saccharibacteria bacterium]|nr:hypothetical protein [Candidatus Saccharibacteria bacterium]